MLEQEIASAMKFIIDKAGNPAPYYGNVPQDFLVPAVFFPQPEIDSEGYTLDSYALKYSWFVKFFAKDTQSAQHMGRSVLTALKGNRNAVPLIDEDGELTDRRFRMKDPLLKPIDDMAVQLTLMWVSPRLYDADDVQKADEINFNIGLKNAFDNAVKQIK